MKQKKRETVSFRISEDRQKEIKRMNLTSENKFYIESIENVNKKFKNKGIIETYKELLKYKTARLNYKYTYDKETEKKHDKSTILTVNVPIEVLEELKRCSEEIGLSTGDIIRRAIYMNIDKTTNKRA